jgi:hypothetical protein
LLEICPAIPTYKKAVQQWAAFLFVSIKAGYKLCVMGYACDAEGVRKLRTVFVAD